MIPNPKARESQDAGHIKNPSNKMGGLIVKNKDKPPKAKVSKSKKKQVVLV